MIVLDASALLALLRDEPGAGVVTDALDGAVISTANLAEVLGKAVDRGMDPIGQARLLDALGIEVLVVTSEDAQRSAVIRARDRRHGRPVLSLGDRLCLALAMRLGVPVLTADRAWDDVDHGVDVQQIR